MSDSDSDSSSDDGFATAGSITRRKLLADFYGKSEGGGGEDEPGPEDHGNRSSSKRISSGRRGEDSNAAVPPAESRRNSADTKNLDSPYFDVEAHTSNHVINSSVHKLLEMDEQLTLQVRTLDSTTQNMVYENYSKFIDATDAVKSVGTNVAANQQGLERLRVGMETINEQSKLVEDELGSLRDAVAEKIRVKRLLTKLDSLLKLPETLRAHIAAGRFRMSASNYLRSTNILGKHSAGFESLQKIETECNGILEEMIKGLEKKFRHWSGQENALNMTGYGSDDDDDNKDYDDDNNSLGDNHSMDDEDEVPPPQSISEIFECAGTLAMLGREKKMDVSVDVQACRSMSLSASVRFLDRLIDETALNAPMTPVIGGGGGEDGTAFEKDHSGRSSACKGQHLVPTTVVDAILETATLFRVSFPDSDDDKPNELEEFVKEGMSSFLLHVRSVLLDYSAGLHSAEQPTDEGEEDGDGDGDEMYEEVAGATSILLHSVRELASGLSLPEVGISADVAADLVEQASDLTETLVRRRVDQKFCDLRLRVCSHCLVPFATRIAGLEEEEEEDSGVSTDQIIQILVSDCLQLLDDTVRSIVSGREELGASAASVDLPMLKQSIQASTGRFAAWLAGTLEVLAGCESSDLNFSFEAAEAKPVDQEANEGPTAGKVIPGQGVQDDVSEIFGYDALAERVDEKVSDLIATLEEKGKVYDSPNFSLKVFQMCRSCERAFVDNMTQSIESNVGGGKKGRSSGGLLFDDKKNVVMSEHERKISGRFQLAASRILTLYATDLGFHSASGLCSTIAGYAAINSEGFPSVPSKAARQVLEIAKQVWNSCEGLFNECRQPGPLPNFSGLPAAQPLLAMNSSPLKGLQLDVERMFQQKISIYPHSSNALDFTGNAVLTVFFKVVIKAVAEQTRNCSFTAGGFSHLLIDVELLRGMTSHFIGKNYQVEGADASSSLSSLLTEVMGSAGGRSSELDSSEQDDLIQSAMFNLKEFIKSDPETLRFIIEE